MALSHSRCLPLQKHSSAKQELEQMLLVVDESDRAEIEDNIAFYDANLSGLSQELEQLKGERRFRCRHVTRCVPQQREIVHV